MTEIITRILQKLAARGLSVNPVASDEHVRGFEDRHAITLPPDYKLFITRVGNGGAGPVHYGLLPLEGVGSDLTPEERIHWTTLPYIRQPFPFTRYWVWEDGEFSTEGTREQVSHGSIMLGTDG